MSRIASIIAVAPSLWAQTLRIALILAGVPLEERRLPVKLASMYACAALVELQCHLVKFESIHRKVDEGRRGPAGD